MKCVEGLLALAIMMVTACNDGRPTIPAQSAHDVNELQPTCDSLLGQATKPTLRLLTGSAWRQRLLDSLITPIGAVRVDSAWVVLDAGNGSLRTFGDLRAPLPRTRSGNGPGELSPLGAVGFRHQQLARGTDGSWLIADALAAHRFSGKARPVGHINRDVATLGPWSDLQVAPWSDSTFLIAANHVGAASAAPALREDHLDLLEVASNTTGPIPLARLDNTFAFSHPAPAGRSRQPPMAPYRDLFGRTWDARASTLAFVSYLARGLCTARRDGQRWSMQAFLSPGPAPRTDAGERVRVLTAYGASLVTPDGGPSPLVDSFANRWPTVPPPYEELIMTEQHDIWALRATGAGQVAVDVFDARGGYRHSFDPVAAYGRGTLPIIVDGRRALLHGDGGAGVLELEIPISSDDGASHPTHDVTDGSR